MKLFVSWSGDLSHGVAKAFAEWISDMLHGVKPFLSSDIEKGAQWPEELARELEDTNYGVVCLTRENLHKDYILFEAGALSKLKHARVSILLIDLKGTDVKAPLSHFQNTKLNEKDVVFKLVQSINSVAGELSEIALKKTFEKWWGEFDEKVQKTFANSKPHAQSPKVQRSTDDLLEEILQIVRGLNVLKPQPMSLRASEGLREMIIGELEHGVPLRLSHNIIRTLARIPSASAKVLAEEFLLPQGLVEQALDALEENGLVQSKIDHERLVFSVTEKGVETIETTGID